MEKRQEKYNCNIMAGLKVRWGGIGGGYEKEFATISKPFNISIKVRKNK